MDKKIIAITGPTGSGKSSVSLALAKKLTKCVYIDVDHIKHMIVSGFQQDTNDAGDKVWVFSEWELLGDSIGLLCQNFVKNGFDVVIGGYLHQESWQRIEASVKIGSKIMLMPAKETIKIRDTERDSKYYMGEDSISEHIDYISKNDTFKDFTVIDSTDQTVDETVSAILHQINT